MNPFVYCFGTEWPRYIHRISDHFYGPSSAEADEFWAGTETLTRRPAVLKKRVRRADNPTGLGGLQRTRILVVSEISGVDVEWEYQN